MTIEEVKKFLEENKSDDEVKELMNSFVTKESVEGFLDTDEGKRLLQPRLDRYHAKSLESWKENNLKDIVDEKVKKLNPEETEEQRKIRELEERLNAAEREKTQQSLLNKVTQQLSKDGLPTDLAGLLITEDEEGLQKNLELYKSVVGTIAESTRKEILKEHGRSTIKGGSVKSEDEKNTVVDKLIETKKTAIDRANAAAEKYGL